jgi:hypothetical protein
MTCPGGLGCSYLSKIYAAWIFSSGDLLNT